MLEAALRALGAVARPEEVLAHHPAFEAAHAALDQETDTDRRRAALAAIEQLMPPAGLGRAFVLSFLATVTLEARYLAALHRLVWQPGFTLEQRHFLYWQRITRHSGIASGPELEAPALYASLLEASRRAVNIKGPWIPRQDRDSNSIVVITNQLLGLAHAPTADCLDYCHVLQTRLKKKVLLINTADMPWTLELPCYRPMRFNYLPEYSTVSRLRVRDEAIEFYQCRKPMPNVDEARLVIATVLTRKPSFVLSLGHSNVTPDLCAGFLTVATMPFGTNLPQARSNLFVLPRARRPEDGAFMEAWRIADEQIIEATYTFRLPDRTATLTRADLGLPPDGFVIAVVGNRLDDEITDVVAEELTLLLSTVPTAFVAFFGTFPTYAQVAATYPLLGGRSAFLGHQRDVPAVLECCDAYFNPPRYGGGSSAAFALAVGLPVLTRNTGDVANITGARFIFPSLYAIRSVVEQSIADPVQRAEWSAAARARFAEIADREAMLRTIVEGAEAGADIRTGLP